MTKILLSAGDEEAPDGALLLACCMNRKRTAAWPEIAPSQKLALLFSLPSHVVRITGTLAGQERRVATLITRA